MALSLQQLSQFSLILLICLAMAFCGISVPPNYHHPQFLIFQNLISASPTTSYKPRLPFSSAICHTSSSFSSFSTISVNERETLPIATRRRAISLSILGFLFSRFLCSSDALASEDLELDRYTDSKEGFTLLVPSSWNKVSLSFCYNINNVILPCLTFFI